MPKKPTYEELEQRVRQLEMANCESKQVKETLRESEERCKRLAEDKLLASEALMAQTQKIAHVGSWRLDVAAHRLTWSDETYRIFGLEPQEFDATYDAFLDAVHPEDRAAVDAAYSGSLREGKETYEIEHRIVRKHTGEIRYVYERCVHERDAAGVVLHSVGMVQDITKRKQAEHALRESEEIFKSFLENSPIYIFFKDKNIKAIRLSKNYEQMIGRPLNEMLGQTMDELFPSELARKMVADDQKILKEGKLVVVEEEFNGRYYTTTKFPIVIDPQTVYLAGYTIDITERLRAEAALRKNEDLLSSIYRAAPTGIGVVSNRILLTVNDRICEMTGYSRDDLIGKCARILYPDDADFEYVGREKYRQISEHGTGTVETHWQRRDGQVIDVLMSSTPINPQDLAAGVTFTALDITERKRAETELRRSHQMFLTVLEGIDATVYVADMHSHEILFMNKHMIDAFGGDLTGRICHEAFRGETAPCGHCTNEHLLDADGRPTGVWAWETRNPLTGKWYINHDRAIQWLDGRMVRLQIASDVTMIKEMEQEHNRIGEQLKQAQKMESVGRLAGGVAHDFNNMLGAILGYTELGLLEVSPADPIHGTLKDIQKAAQRSADLTRQLLAFARKQTVTPRVLDLNKTVEGMLSMLRQLIGENIDLAWLPGKDLGPVRMDPSQIEQMLANLCVNARDAIPDTGKISVETGTATFDEAYCAAHVGSVPGEYLLLAVSDNGCGMDAETRSHLFEPFFTTKEVGKGTGLGLATVYGMVKQNNGFIDVCSRPGQGTTFNIYLPRHAAEADRTAKMAAAHPTAQGYETILVVEDEPMILDIAVKILNRHGYTVMAAATPGEAIRLAREHAGEIHLLMTDVVMPEMNGKDLAKNLLSLYPNLKRLFMSGYTADVIAHHGVLDEGVQFIQKPFAVQTLATKVREVLDKT